MTFDEPLKRILIISGAIVVFLVAVAPGAFFYVKYQRSQELLQQYPLLLQDDTKSIVSQVEKLIDLPKDEDPILATVTDVDKVKDQPFFAKAKNGDKVLMYTKAKKAFLYDPIANKILEVGPYLVPPPTPITDVIGESSPTSTDSEKATQSSTPSATLKVNKPLKVNFYNGTSTVGLTKVVENQLKEKMSNVETVDRDNANKRDYTTTLVIDLTGNNKDEAKAIAEALSAEISSLPAGEAKPTEGDFLIIVGNDKK